MNIPTLNKYASVWKVPSYVHFTDGRFEEVTKVEG